ncbi:HECT-domain-containing protein [Apiospora hydei]|uniref:HECT-type E3 ubiquitin transferase n=1 Tax=Apiospora hydei TaxID=1337664 RepID=A0ABR1XDS3_9PEZI
MLGTGTDQGGAASVPAAPQASTADASSSTSPAQGPSAGPAAPVPGSQATIPKDILDAERAKLRNKLIERCLDIIRAHPTSSYEVSELITAVVLQPSADDSAKQDVGETLVNALMSFAADDDLKSNGRSIAAYAHLLSLLLQDRGFFSVTIGSLRENTTEFLRFLQVPAPSTEELPPWIPYILLIFEILLSDDEQPPDIQWKPPTSEEDPIEPFNWPYRDLIVKEDDRGTLLESILEILPRVGKDESMAISLLRILVIFTRNRTTAKTVGDKKNLQRLFVMTKQLSGFGPARLSENRISTYVLTILRHIIEDEDIIKQLMRSEIRAVFDKIRTGQRPLDVPGYLRQLSHVALRDPKLFVTVTDEMVKLQRWTFSENGVSPRQHVLLKEPKADANKDDVTPTVRATEGLSIQDVKPSTEGNDKQVSDATKPAGHDTKRPILENADGVIHFLLCELLNYREVDDKEPPRDTKDPKDSTASTSSTSKPLGESTSDTQSSDSKEKKPKASFKADEHPIFIYRCFLLRCLTELLQSYNRTKVEFINFKRSAPLQTNTPIKPRTSVLNYLLTDLLCAGNIDGLTDSLTDKKKMATAAQAQKLLVALVGKTIEKPVSRSREKFDYDEEEPDLLFVRKFVIDTILKAYKDAYTSNEPFDSRYGKMLHLSTVMQSMVDDKEKDIAVASRNNPDPSPDRSQAQLRRLMYEKGYLAALNSSLADIDLAFPPVKKTIKSVLRVLRTLTHTAIQLSHANILPAASSLEDVEDDIASATSLSDMDDDREETPDLYRNSALGMMEPGRDMEEDYSDGSDDGLFNSLALLLFDLMLIMPTDDEEMYDDEYDDEMEYDDNPSLDGEDNVSDEDEDVEGMGPIEGLPGDLAVVDVTMEEDDEDEDDEMDDSDDDMSEDDDDMDSEDMGDIDDRIHIVDDDGNPVEDDGASGWESETDEDANDGEEDDDVDIDYEGEAQDLEEAQIHGLDDVGGIVGGRLGHMLQHHLGEGHDEDYDGHDEIHNIGNNYGEEDEDEDGMHPLRNRVFARMDTDFSQKMMKMRMIWMKMTTVLTSFLVSSHSHPSSRCLKRFTDFESEDDPPPHGVFSGMGGLDTLVLEQHGGDGFFGGPRPHRHGLRDHFPPLPFIMGREHLASLGDTRNPNRPGGNEDGLNPLLRRANDIGRDASPRPPNHPNRLIRLLGAGRGESPISFINELLSSTLGARHGHALQFSITSQGPGGEVQELALPLPHQLRGAEGRRETYNEPSHAAMFSTDTTSDRWLDEAKMIFGTSTHDKAIRLQFAVLSSLIPPAIEAEKENKKREAEVKRKLEEERKKREEEERKAREAREAQEAEERAAKEKAEAEERERAEAAAAELAAQAATQATEENEASNTDDAMEGVESTGDSPAGAHAEATSDQPRVLTTIRGEQVDVTELGIDADYLEALPEEFREEVIAQTISQRRSAAREDAPRRQGEQGEVFQEFLDALPDELRQEIVQQERAEQRRRDREEARRQNAAPGHEAAPQDMDPASILMTFPRICGSRRLVRHHGGGDPREIANPYEPGRENPRQAGEAVEVITKPQRKIVAQMLDKSGVATLLRLMFINVKGGSLEGSLRHVFKDICENKQTRLEVISTLLQILQDGTTDVDAVERSFAQLSIKARQPKADKEGKTPQSLKRSLTGLNTNQLTHTGSETSPVLIVQQCLDLLCYLAAEDVHVPAVFLTEQETVGLTLKRTLSRKGKGKESKVHKFAINSLLALLDRDLVVESSSIMDALSLVLSRITYPLLSLDKKLKEGAEAIKDLDKKIAEKEKEPTSVPTAEAAEAATTSSDPKPETSTAQPGDASTTTTAVPDSETAKPEDATAKTAPEASIEKLQERKQFIQKRIKTYVPPVIPVHNLTLIINIFVARECSSKTFKETLSAIKNLSLIPGAMGVFGQELARQARVLSEKIVVHLDELLPHIEKASTGTEIQGVALAKFSPGAADQNKLLRVLTALDHLFAQKKPESSDSSEPSNETKKQDLLATLYRNTTFNALWDRLSACLSAIRQRESFINVATILLPLIEALMVVCKDTTSEVLAQSQGQDASEMLLSSPPPESHNMASLFFKFTEEHRRILNELVRNNPSLMKGTFSHLVKNPKVLEFDNKRNYFNRSVHNRSQVPNGRSFGTLQLSVRREHVFHDSFKSLYFKSGDEMKFGKLNIRFHGEEGVDAGGVTREWFQVLSRQMFDPNYALFVPVSSDRTTFHPNKLSGINDEHLMFFKFIGRVIGKALYEGRLLDCYFSRAVYKRILSKPVSVKDMESFDPEYYKSLVWMLENDITDIITESFAVEDDEFGVKTVADLIPNGRDIPVTEENKNDYVRLVVEHKLLKSVKDQMEHFLKGFHEIIPAELIAIFNEQELELLISGLPDIDVDDWKSNTEYHNYTPSSQQIQWFWRAVRSFDKEELAKLLQFVTGTSKVPLNGFKELEGMNGINRFNIHRDYGNKERLPSSHTCFNRKFTNSPFPFRAPANLPRTELDLPEYESYDTLRAQVIKAITAGSDYFGFA